MSKYPVIEADDIELSISVAQYLPKVNWCLKDADHPTWLFFWNPSGTAKLVFNGKDFRVGSEYAVLMPPHTRISAYSDAPFPHIYAHFKAPAHFDGVRRQPFLLPPEEADRFYREKRYQSPGWRSAVCWKILLWEYLMMLDEDAFGESSETTADERIARAMQLCEKRSADPPDNVSLARSVGMSVNNFYRLFRRETGTSPRRYREGLRLDFARKMLLNSDAGIAAIARHCGYADRYQFSKAFKKYFGLTPAEVRSCRKSVVNS